MQKQNFKSQINEIVKLIPAQLTSFTVFKWTYPFSLILAVTTTATNIQGPSEYLKWLTIGFSGKRTTSVIFIMEIFTLKRLKFFVIHYSITNFTSLVFYFFNFFFGFIT